MTLFVSPLYVVLGNIEQHQSRITPVGFSRVLSDVAVSYAVKEKTKQVGLGKNNSFIETLQEI